MASPPGKANQEVQMPGTPPCMKILVASIEVGFVYIHHWLSAQRSQMDLQSSWEISVSSVFLFWLKYSRLTIFY